MSLTTRVLLGLILGFALGLVVAAVPSLAPLPVWIEPVGTLFINGIRMTVVPLVAASLIAGVASAPDARAVGRLGGRAVAWFIGIVATSVTIGVLVLPVAFRLIGADPARAAAMRAGPSTADLAERAKAVPSLAQWVVGLLPPNPVQAAATDAMLPLIVFSVLFGLALTSVSAERRAPLLRFVETIRDVAFVLVRWVLVLAPIGVFALAVPLASRLGIAAAGAVAWYIGVVSVLCVLFMGLVLYPAVRVFGGVSIRDFARAALPVQAVAMSSRSSMASLPVMIERFGPALSLPANVTGFLMPLSASTFRAGAGIGITGGVFFLAALYGVQLSVAQLVTVGATTAVLSFSVPGIPAGSIIVMVPVLLAAGLPMEGVGMLIGVDTIPDMFRTTTNATGTMAVSAILGARERINAAT